MGNRARLPRRDVSRGTATSPVNRGSSSAPSRRGAAGARSAAIVVPAPGRRPGRGRSRRKAERSGAVPVEMSAKRLAGRSAGRRGRTRSPVSAVGALAKFRAMVGHPLSVGDITADMMAKALAGGRGQQNWMSNSNDTIIDGAGSAVSRLARGEAPTGGKQTAWIASGNEREPLRRRSRVGGSLIGERYTMAEVDVRCIVPTSMPPSPSTPNSGLPGRAHPAPGFRAVAWELRLLLNQPGASGAGRAMPDGRLPNPAARTASRSRWRTSPPPWSG